MADRGPEDDDTAAEPFLELFEGGLNFLVAVAVLVGLVLVIVVVVALAVLTAQV